MTRLEQLIKKCQALQKEIWEIEARETDNKNASLVGKCFVFKNSFGGTKPEDRWNLYQKVTGVENGNLRVFQFEKDVNGSISIENTIRVCIHADQIESEEFERALSDLKAEIAAMR